MSWVVLIGLAAALGAALLAVLVRRRELSDLRRTIASKQRAADIGAAKAELQHPVVDLTLCVGCGTCVRACPEEGVLDLVHGQAAVVRGAHCVGTAACERECPTGAITVTLADAAEREDVPVLEESLEAVGAPGLFLAGEVTAHALIKTAVDHGAAVAAEVAQRVEAGVEYESEYDLLIVGAGPAGLACALEAKTRGLRFVMIDQESAPGGTVAKYPRAKLVMSQPVTMPIYGRFKQTSYVKEELVELWARMVEEQQLPLHLGVVYEGLQRREDGGFDVFAGGQVLRARHVCLAIGRRGSPNRLGIPGEDLPKVAFSLLDAASYQGRRVVVVGGGDSAVEAAVGLSEQAGNEVTLVYRREAIFRCKPKNERLLEAAVEAGRVRLCLNAQPVAIHPDRVELDVREPDGTKRYALPNDQVFVMAGGTPPVAQLEASGVSFDPSLRPPPAALVVLAGGDIALDFDAVPTEGGPALIIAETTPEIETALVESAEAAGRRVEPFGPDLAERLSAKVARAIAAAPPPEPQPEPTPKAPTDEQFAAVAALMSALGALPLLPQNIDEADVLASPLSFADEAEWFAEELYLVAPQFVMRE
ncbi:MAG: NAD(P)-binding domain-containing protein, partial [Planctomycetota bacterium]